MQTTNKKGQSVKLFFLLFLEKKKKKRHFIQIFYGRGKSNDMSSLIINFLV